MLRPMVKLQLVQKWRPEAYTSMHALRFTMEVRTLVSEKALDLIRALS